MFRYSFFVCGGLTIFFCVGESVGVYVGLCECFMRVFHVYIMFVYN